MEAQHHHLGDPVESLFPSRCDSMNRQCGADFTTDAKGGNYTDQMAMCISVMELMLIWKAEYKESNRLFGGD